MPPIGKAVLIWNGDHFENDLCLYATVYSSVIEAPFWCTRGCTSLASVVDIHEGVSQ